jgi:hypothetical protein
MRTLTYSLAAIAMAACALLPAGAARAQTVSAADCIDFGKPKPATTYVFRRSDSGGQSSQYSQRWTQFTGEQSSVSVVRGSISEVVVNQHKVENDVTMISATASTASNSNSRTTFRPAVMGDPMFRACAGRSWKIQAVAATHEEAGRTVSANTYAGTMRIVALRETIQVPAGTFPCVHYTRTMATPGGQSVDDYWKSIEHGVVVRQVSKLGGWSSTSQLTAIR